MIALSRGMTALIISRGMGSGPKENRCSARAVAYIRADSRQRHYLYRECFHAIGSRDMNHR